MLISISGFVLADKNNYVIWTTSIILYSSRKFWAAPRFAKCIIHDECLFVQILWKYLLFLIHAIKVILHCTFYWVFFLLEIFTLNIFWHQSIFNWLINNMNQKIKSLLEWKFAILVLICWDCNVTKLIFLFPVTVNWLPPFAKIYCEHSILHQTSRLTVVAQ